MQINMSNPYWGGFNGGQPGIQQPMMPMAQSIPQVVPMNNGMMVNSFGPATFNNFGNGFGQSFGGGFWGGMSSSFDNGGFTNAMMQMVNTVQMMISQFLGGGRQSGPCGMPPAQAALDGCKAPVYQGGQGGRYWGDPHLVGFDGENYDVMGQDGKIYNMLSDKNVQYNTKFTAWGGDGATVISEAGLQVGKDQVFFDRSGNAPTVNGKPMETGQNIQLDGGKGSASWDGSKLVVNTGEYTVDLAVKEKDNNGGYLDSNVSINKEGPFQDYVAPHGLLGQTADGVAGAKTGNLGIDQGKQGGTVIDGKVDDYEEANLFSNQSKFNRFGVQIGNVQQNGGNVEQVTDTQGNVIFKRPTAPVGGQAGATAPQEARPQG